MSDEVKWSPAEIEELRDDLQKLGKEGWIEAAAAAEAIATLQQQLAAAREANARLCSLLIDSPRGLVEQVWTRKVSHEVTIDVMGAHLDMTGKTYRLVDEAAIATLQRDRQP